ncbi:DNA polymerase Y family protein [Rheinheimera metallidurans]|uniref:Y-family DNA polymerase n=1 Tax=Rheinheimera metallidurans TaxID=2925781 RepID=UPI00300312C2
MLYLYLQFPALQLESLTSETTVKLPIAVVDEKHQIVQCNKQATELGIKLGMQLGTAAGLCPNLQLIPYQIDAQQQALQSVAQQLYQVSSDIALDPPSGLYLRLCNMLALYQGINGYWQAVTAELALLPYQYFYATGGTPFIAKCLARLQLNSVSDNVSSSFEIVKRSPLNATELDTDIQQQLTRLGIHNLGQLLNLATAELARRFDSRLLNYLGQLRGDFYHALNYIQPQQGFSRYLELLYDITDTKGLTAPLSSLLTQLEQQLTRANARCHQLQISLFFRAKPALLLEVGSAQAESSAKRWLTLCQHHLERLMLPEPVTGLKLKVHSFTRPQQLNDDLFQPQQGNVSALQLVATLQAKLGNAAVTGLNLENQHWPELASSQHSPLMSANQQIAALTLRPAFLLAKPLPLNETIEINSGPERLCQDGWQLHAQRDYFVGRSKTGQWLWLYRTPEQRWFVQGLFS